MSSDRDLERTRGCELSYFERNRYFYGKLVTARDMQAEQDYHVDRLNTLSRYVAGEGIVCGLSVAGVEESGDRIEITVEPGVALDCCGNPVLVEIALTQTLDAPTGDEIYVYLTRGESSKDRVPVPGSDRSAEEECTYNRILETSEVTYRESPPDSYKTVPDVEFPSGDELADGSTLVKLARAYHQQQLEECNTCDDRSVFLGSFERRSGGWREREEETERRPHVYTNDMLYASIAEHIADQGNPHNVSVEGISDELLDRLEELESTGELVDRLDELEDRLEALASYEERLERLEEQKSSLESYVMYKTLDYKVRTFRDVAAEFNSEIAGEVATTAKDAILDEAFENQDGYLDLVDELSNLEEGAMDELESEVTEESLEEYSNALEELKAVAEAREDVLEVAMAQDRVCEAAEWLREEDYDIDRA